MCDHMCFSFASCGIKLQVLVSQGLLAGLTAFKQDGASQKVSAVLLIYTHCIDVVFTSWEDMIKSDVPELNSLGL